MNDHQPGQHSGTVSGAIVGTVLNLFGQADASNAGHTILVLLGSILAACASAATTQYFAARRAGRSNRDALNLAVPAAEDAALRWASDYLSSRGHTIIPPADRWTPPIDGAPRP